MLTLAAEAPDDGVTLGLSRRATNQHNRKAGWAQRKTHPNLLRMNVAMATSPCRGVVLPDVGFSVDTGAVGNTFKFKYCDQPARL